MASQQLDENDLSSFDNHETATKLPLGWVLLFLCAIVFGIFYCASYMPQISGWSQVQEYQESVK